MPFKPSPKALPQSPLPLRQRGVLLRRSPRVFRQNHGSGHFGPQDRSSPGVRGQDARDPLRKVRQMNATKRAASKADYLAREIAAALAVAEALSRDLQGSEVVTVHHARNVEAVAERLEWAATTLKGLRKLVSEAQT